jgi:hypothetical protein
MTALHAVGVLETLPRGHAAVGEICPGCSTILHAGDRVAPVELRANGRTLCKLACASCAPGAESLAVADRCARALDRANTRLLAEAILRIASAHHSGDRAALDVAIDQAIEDMGYESDLVAQALDVLESGEQDVPSCPVATVIDFPGPPARGAGTQTTLPSISAAPGGRSQDLQDELREDGAGACAVHLPVGESLTLRPSTTARAGLVALACPGRSSEIDPREAEALAEDSGEWTIPPWAAELGVTAEQREDRS